MPRGGLCLQAESCGEVERAALAGFAFNPKSSAHQSRQPGRNGQAQTRASILPGRRTIGLRKGLENQPLLFRRNANPCVGYDKVQTNLLLGLRFRLNADGYLTLLGELNGVVDEIEEDLPQATWIADERLGHFGRDMASQVQSLLAGAESEHSDDIVDGIAQVELDAIKVQLSCLDLGKVQDVVDHC